MKVTQGTFSYLPDLTDAQIKAQIQYCLDNEWAISIEHTDDPHPRNSYWEMWGLPMFDLKDPAAIMLELNSCRKTFPNRYIKVNGYDRRYTKQTVALSFIVNRPAEEPGFRLDRQESADRQVRYTLHSYATERPSGKRYGEG
ncbi:MAG TPA: ribulose bisphosphate carboxylase small subunit [Gemmatimonadales bacterium]|nr:ribulose bisphosphate carboxylase small subunit [Gemmatimonadales bacterium]